MTTFVEPSPNTTPKSFPWSGAVHYGGGVHGWVIPETASDAQDGTYADYVGIDKNSLGEFDADWSSGSLLVTVEGGEAFVHGKYVAIDEPTQVTLPDNDTVTVYVGYPADSADNVLVDIGHNMPTDHGRLPLWTFTTDGSGVTNTSDDRALAPDEAMGAVTYGRNEADARFYPREEADAEFVQRVGGDTLEGNYEVEGNFSVTGDATVENDLTVEGDEIAMPNASGNAGLRFDNGARFSQFNGWATAYSYSDDGGEGFRVRNPDGEGDLLTVDAATGDTWIEGGLAAEGAFSTAQIDGLGEVHFHNDPVELRYDPAEENERLQFIRGSGSFGNDVMTFFGMNVGIHTNTPTEPLDVDGVARVRDEPEEDDHVARLEEIDDLDTRKIESDTTQNVYVGTSPPENLGYNVLEHDIWVDQSGQW